MANPMRGEVALVLDGRPHVARLTLAALAELEAELQADGLTGLVAQHHWTVVTGCLLGSLWAFVLGCFMWVTVFTDTAANPWWPGIMWFLALHYTLLGMSFTERYLLPRTP